MLTIFTTLETVSSCANSPPIFRTFFLLTSASLLPFMMKWSTYMKKITQLSMTLRKKRYNASNEFQKVFSHFIKNKFAFQENCIHVNSVIIFHLLTLHCQKIYKIFQNNLLKMMQFEKWSRLFPISRIKTALVPIQKDNSHVKTQLEHDQHGICLLCQMKLSRKIYGNKTIMRNLKINGLNWKMSTYPKSKSVS